jgi:hypothetical protein
VTTLFRGNFGQHEHTVIPVSQPARFTEPYPKNAPGAFYVENNECIACGAPHAVAPDLMEWDHIPSPHGGTYPHCYFKRQPKTPEELQQAIEAIAVSCCGAIRYRGADPEICKRLKERGCSEAIVNL